MIVVGEVERLRQEALQRGTAWLDTDDHQHVGQHQGDEQRRAEAEESPQIEVAETLTLPVILVLVDEQGRDEEATQKERRP